MSKKQTVGQQVKSGLVLTAGCILGGAWLGLVIWGVTNAFGTDANFSERHHPSRVLGYFLLLIAGLIFVATANRWKRAFPGIMVAATLGAILELEHGHIVNNPTVIVPRPIALIQLIVIVEVTLLSFTFKSRPLGLLDRIALLIFAASIYVGGDEAIQHKVPFALIAGGICVLAAWAIDRLHVNRANRVAS